MTAIASKKPSPDPIPPPENRFNAVAIPIVSNDATKSITLKSLWKIRIPHKIPVQAITKGKDTVCDRISSQEQIINPTNKTIYVLFKRSPLFSFFYFPHLLHGGRFPAVDFKTRLTVLRKPEQSFVR